MMIGIKKSNIRNFIIHLGFFVIVEIIFALIIFREIPSGDLFTLTGVLHLSFWVIIAIAGGIREKYAHRVRQKFLATYLPVLYHVAIHIYVAMEMIYEIEERDHIHDKHTIARTIAATIAAGVLIALGEYRLHRTTHCETHHTLAHKHCHDEDCEQTHETIRNS